MKNLLASATSFIGKIVSGGPKTQPETLPTIDQFPSIFGNCKSGSCSQSVDSGWQNASWEQPAETQPDQPQTALNDPHGIAPGTDLELTGKFFAMRFYGHFYMMPQYRSIELVRPVVILFASAEVYVAQDMLLGNIYVVLRKDNISQGCQMMTELLPVAEDFKGFKPTMKLLEE